VKILFNKKDTALIQIAEPQQAILAFQNLDLGGEYSTFQASSRSPAPEPNTQRTAAAEP